MWWWLLLLGSAFVVVANATKQVDDGASEPEPDNDDKNDGKPTPHQYTNWRELGTWHGDAASQARFEMGRYEMSVHEAPPGLDRFRIVGRLLWREHANPGNFGPEIAHEVEYARFYDVAFDLRRVGDGAWEVVQSQVRGVDAHIQGDGGEELRQPGVWYKPKPRLGVATSGPRAGDVVITYTGGHIYMILSQLKPSAAGDHPISDYFIDSVRTVTRWSWDLKVYAPRTS